MIASLRLFGMRIAAPFAFCIKHDIGSSIAGKQHSKLIIQHRIRLYIWKVKKLKI